MVLIGADWGMIGGRQQAEEVEWLASSVRKRLSRLYLAAHQPGGRKLPSLNDYAQRTTLLLITYHNLLTTIYLPHTAYHILLTTYCLHIPLTTYYVLDCNLIADWPTAVSCHHVRPIGFLRVERSI